jgi:hypothetical protein
MTEKQHKTIRLTGMLLCALVGSTYGLVYTLGGYLFDWGPGGSLEGPFWKILLTGALSIVIAAYAGELVVRKLAKRIFEKDALALSTAVRAFVVALIGSMITYILGWEVGYIAGKITGAITDLEWHAILLYVPFMALIWGIPVCGIASLLYGVFVFFYLRAGMRVEH